MKNLCVLVLFFLAFTFPVTAQNEADAKKITATYDLKKIQEKQHLFKKKEDSEKLKALEFARKNSLPIRTINNDGSISELMRISPLGFPIYYTTENANAAKSTRATFLNTGGSLGLDLNGQNMVARVWDGGTVRSTHNSFSNRVTIVDNPSSTTYALHSTHVTGTIMASNAVAATRGMAYQATARTFNWTNDLSEVMSEVQLGMLISNHSYGTPITNGSNILPPFYIGAYTPDARDWDEAAYLSPYYLMVASAGNEGNNNDNSNPIGFGYDKLVGNKTCKNNLVVANAQDANISANGALISVAINSSSSQGPTDDMRIKPDITGNGTALTSTSSQSNTATDILTGTSMASPNVAGTLLLLQQHYKNLTNSFMKSATLKGLACHTADDAGLTGPDAKFGWGLLNAKKAAETLSGNGITSWVSEENLAQDQTYTMTVRSDGTTPLIASVTWTDLPGTPIMDDLTDNDPTPRLVNDLDIRITKNTTTYYPWRLDFDPNNPALRDGDNNVDNVEVVKIDAPAAGDYTITVTHKGTLVTGSQNYALVITGISSAFSLTSTSADLEICANQNATFNFNYKQTGSGTTTFSAVGLPSGASASFSSPSLSANGVVTMTITGLSGIQPGNYYIGIKGTNASETETRYKTLRVFNSTFQNTALSTPTHQQIGLSTSVNLKWANDVNAETYTVQVATDAAFNALIINENAVTTNQYLATDLNEETRYYWRVIPSNRCGDGQANTATVFSFDTGVLVCGTTVFSATDFSNATIASVANSSASVPVTITGGYTIGNIKVNLNITHTYVEDMTITLVGPMAIGSPNIVLLQEPCGDNDNINCTFDDTGNNPACSGNPSISGLIVPDQSLSALNTLGADGDWTLMVDDPYNGDGGTINSFSIDICYVIPSAMSTQDNLLTNVSIYPNPTKDIINVRLPELNGQTILRLHDIQGREILSKETNVSNEVLNVDHLQEGVYLLSIENGNSKITKKVVIRK